MLKRFYVTYERPYFYTVEVDALDESEAENRADEILIACGNIEKFYSCQGDLEISSVEPASETALDYPEIHESGAS